MNQQTHLKVGASLSWKGIFRIYRPSLHLLPTLLLCTFEQCLQHFLLLGEATPEIPCTESLASGLFPLTLHCLLLPPEYPPPMVSLASLLSPPWPGLPSGPITSCLGQLQQRPHWPPRVQRGPQSCSLHVAIARPIFPPHNVCTISHFCLQCVRF